MKYIIKNKQLCGAGDSIGTDDYGVEIIDRKTFRNRTESDTSKTLHSFAAGFEAVEYCKVDIFSKYIAGAFVIPHKEHVLTEEICICFYMNERNVVFIDDSTQTKEVLERFMKLQTLEKKNVVHFLFEFMEFFIHDDVLFLQKYEKQMSEMEEEILEGHTEAFNEKIMGIRKELLRFYTYYQQLADISEILEENVNQMLSDEECRMFGLYSNRVDRLYDHTLMLKEYSQQVREMYQSQIDIRQNQIMKFLTVVTTVFMPLTLIAGWYGMNFVNMPELRADQGYLVIIIISLLITAIQVWVFKIKKWF